MKKIMFAGVFIVCASFLANSLYEVNIADTMPINANSVKVAETIPIYPSQMNVTSWT